MAFLRIAVGLFFLIFGEYKVFGTQFVFGGGFQSWIHKFIEDGAYPFMIPILRGFVLPHATSIALIVAYGELAIGLSLVSGIAVRASSTAGVAYMLSLLFPSNYPGAHAPIWQYFGASLSHSAFAVCFTAFLVGRSERIWSLAGWRQRSRQESAKTGQSPASGVTRRSRQQEP
jgi:uncharacterized membrane protein YphA (DoxX/SURF4 family)